MNQIEELRYLILAVQREGSRRMSTALETLGITTSQSEVLRVLYDNEPLSLIELGAHLVCETGSPSRLVGRLISDGYINQEISKQDRRKIILSLTPQGRETVTNIVCIENAFYQSMETILEGSPLNVISDLLWRIIEGTPSARALTLRKKSSDENK